MMDLTDQKETTNVGAYLILVLALVALTVVLYLLFNKRFTTRDNSEGSPFDFFSRLRPFLLIITPILLLSLRIIWWVHEKDLTSSDTTSSDHKSHYTHAHPVTHLNLHQPKEGNERTQERLSSEPISFAAAGPETTAPSDKELSAKELKLRLNGLNTHFKFPYFLQTGNELQMFKKLLIEYETKTGKALKLAHIELPILTELGSICFKMCALSANEPQDTSTILFLKFLKANIQQFEKGLQSINDQLRLKEFYSFFYIYNTPKTELYTNLTGLLEVDALIAKKPLAFSHASYKLLQVIAYSALNSHGYHSKDFEKPILEGLLKANIKPLDHISNKLIKTIGILYYKDHNPSLKEVLKEHMTKLGNAIIWHTNVDIIKGKDTWTGPISPHLNNFKELLIAYYLSTGTPLQIPLGMVRAGIPIALIYYHMLKANPIDPQLELFGKVAAPNAYLIATQILFITIMGDPKCYDDKVELNNLKEVYYALYYTNS